MNSQEYRNLQEAYLQVYSASTLNEFGPGDVGGSFNVGTTYGGAPGTKQKTTVSGSASSGGSNVSGSLTKGTFSGQGDETSRGVDNAIRNYETGSNGNTSTSTSTTGVRGTLDANVSGKFGPGSNTQDKIKAEMQKREMLRTAATNIQNQQKAKAAAERLASSTRTSTPDDGKSAAQQETDKANSEKEARNSKYLKDRTEVRNQLASETEITYSEAKTIINALLMGAQLGNNSDSDIYQILNGDKARIEFLKQNDYIKQLREDIKICWEYIKPTMTRKQITTKKGHKRILPLSSNQKAGLYFQLERKVLNSVKTYMDKTNNQYFLEHDGFVCKNLINLDAISDWIYNDTQFVIQLAKEQLV